MDAAKTPNAPPAWNLPFVLLFRLLFFGTVGILFSLLFTRVAMEAERPTTVKHHIAHAAAVYEFMQMQAEDPELKEPPRNLPSGRRLRGLKHNGFFHLLISVHRLTGLPFSASGVLLLSTIATLIGVVVFTILRFAVPQYGDLVLLPATAVLLTVSAIYLPFFNRGVYFGQGSPNIWHNATAITAKLPALASFYLVIYVMQQPANRRSLFLGTLASLIMAASVYAKPSYVVVFLPAYALYLLASHATPRAIHKNGIPFAIFIRALLIVLPALCIVGYQYVRYFNSPGPSIHIGLVWFEVWRLFSPNIFISILITLAFPLYVFLMRRKVALRQEHFRVAWIVAIVGMMQFAFLANINSQGGIMKSADWIGGYLVGLNLLFISTMIVFLQWAWDARGRGIVEKCAIALGGILLLMHTASGCFYFYELCTRFATRIIWQVQ